jgi:hypothetical protein
MNFQDMQKSMIWRLLIIGLIVDIILAFIIWYFIRGSDQAKWSSAFFIVAAFWIGTAVTGIRMALFHFVLHTRVPPPFASERQSFSYLERMANDSDEDVDSRIKATMLSTAFETSGQFRGFMRNLVFNVAADRAVERYFQTEPKRPERPEADSEDYD